MECIPFDSAKHEYKSVFGSIAAGKSLRFRVCLPRAMRVTGVRMVIHNDFRTERRDFFWESTDNITEWWGTDFTPDTPDVYFYHFEADSAWGVSRIMRTKTTEGALTHDGKEWQLTVYDASFSTPERFRGGILYQIFPDRFYCSGKPKTGVPSDRIMRQDWYGTPKWKRDADGEIRNNDFFGGDLRGITEKLPYLQSLGVTCIYLNPIVLSHSNHRYDTADYTVTDALLGTVDDFSELCEKAHEAGMTVLFDGVYSHTGDDSIYFNRYGRYPGIGAYQSVQSPYHAWYRFRSFPDKYDCWWGVPTLPEVDENNPDFTAFITGSNGVIEQWLRAGADGVRLDVADELPDAFLDRIRMCIKSVREDAFILGEVWEDASNKISYGHRRRFLLGRQLDSVMNYPFRTAVLDFAKDGIAEKIADTVLSVCENYPSPALHCMMNMLGTHDTERAITLLAGIDCSTRSREWQAEVALSAEQYKKGKSLYQFALSLLYMLPGIPCLYYADEAGLTGCKDPFNRACYPWGREDEDLLAFVRELGTLRHGIPECKDGAYHPVSATMQCFAFRRGSDCHTGILVIANRNNHPIDYYFHSGITQAQPLFQCTEIPYGLRIPACRVAVARLQ